MKIQTPAGFVLLSGTWVDSGNHAVRITAVENVSSFGLNLTQHLFYTDVQRDSSIHIILKGLHERRDTVYFNYNDTPACPEEYPASFPIPFW